MKGGMEERSGMRGQRASEDRRWKWLRAGAVMAVVLLLLPGVVAADQYVGGIPLRTVQDGTVSGDLWVGSFYGIAGQTAYKPNTVVKSFALPDHTSIAWARLYVAVYCGHMESNYQGSARVKFDGNGDGSFERTLGTEALDVPYSFPAEGGSGPVWLNDHCNRVCSDYLMWYDVTSLIRGRAVAAEVFTESMPGYEGTFDGRVKLITLVAAYDDGDGDQVRYWVNDGHDVHSYRVEETLLDSYTGETEFATESLPEGWESARLSAVYIASENGIYSFEGSDLDVHAPQGSYAGSESWDVTDLLSGDSSSVFTYERTGTFYKIPLSLLAVRSPEAEAGSIGITSHPAGARILLDGEETGFATNATLNGVPVGEHAVSVVLDNYASPETEWVTVAQGETAAVHFSLEPLNGSIAVSSDPAGARIYLDGEDTGLLTDAVIEEVIAGPHTVRISLAGYLDASAEAVVAADETVQVALDLVPDAGGGSSGGDTVQDEGYAGHSLALHLTDTYRGGLLCANASMYSGLIPAGSEYAYPLRLGLPENSTIRKARLYVYTTWSHNTARKAGVMPSFGLSFNGTPAGCDAVYTDRKGEGIYDYVLATSAYDVTDLIRGPGDYTVTLRNTGAPDEEFAAYGVLLAVLYENASLPVVTCWITEGCDAIFADASSGIGAEEAATTAAFEGDVAARKTDSAVLILIATAATGLEEEEHAVTFNDGEWFNILTGGSSSISIATLDVRPFLHTTGNTATIASIIGGTKGDYLENRGAFLVVTHGTDGDAAVADDETNAGKAVSAVTSDRTYHPLAGAAHISIDGGTFELYVSEGTRIEDAAGNPVTGIRSGPVFGEQVPVLAVSLTPENATANLPMILSAHLASAGSEPTFARWNAEGGEWQVVASDYDAESGTLFCRIRSLGTYAVLAPDPGSSAAADSAADPVGWVIRGITSLFSGLLAFIGLAQEEIVEPGDTALLPPPPEAAGETGMNEGSEPRRLFFNCTVLSNPTGGLIRLDGVYAGRTTPATLAGVPYGEHVISVNLDGFEASSERILIDRDREITLELYARDGPSLNKLKFEGPLNETAFGHTGGIYVTSHPDEAEISIDGKKIDSVTPRVIYGLKSGMHSVRVKKAGITYNVETKKVWVYENRITPVSFDKDETILRRTAIIESGRYSGYPVTVNGIYRGDTVPCEVEIAGIDPYLTVWNGSAFLSHRMIGWRDGGTVTIAPDAGAPGTIRVDSRPAGAAIAVDGFPTGFATPYCISNLSEGPHTISLSKPGYLPETETIWLIDDPSEVDAEIWCTLTPYVYGSLSVTSTPAGARIYLYNADTGEKTPHTFSYMNIGTYSVKIVAEGSSRTLEDILVNPYGVTASHANLTA